MIETRKISWFSAGVSSAVATWLTRESIDQIIYCHIDDQEDDTLRFVDGCAAWFGQPIRRLQSPLKNVENACLYRAFVNSPGGASCTRMLKRELRAQWEAETIFFNRYTYVWGMDADEADRADAVVEAMPEHEHEFPLIENGISKREAHGILGRAGIRRPRMYDLGYPNNNCVGCVKGGKGYWNKIRVDFPATFIARGKMERRIGGSCINGTYLDELDPEAGRKAGPVVPECGIFCQVQGGADESGES